MFTSSKLQLFTNKQTRWLLLIKLLNNFNAYFSRSRCKQYLLKRTCSKRFEPFTYDFERALVDWFQNNFDAYFIRSSFKHWYILLRKQLYAVPISKACSKCFEFFACNFEQASFTTSVFTVYIVAD